jgi:hypothetical protein
VKTYQTRKRWGGRDFRRLARPDGRKVEGGGEEGAVCIGSCCHSEADQELQVRGAGLVCEKRQAGGRELVGETE